MMQQWDAMHLSQTAARDELDNLPRSHEPTQEQSTVPQSPGRKVNVYLSGCEK